MQEPVITGSGMRFDPTTYTARSYSAPAVRCVVKQQYPIDPEVWPEAIDLISHICGVDMRERSHDLVMGDAKALSLAAAASENLRDQLKSILPTETDRDLFLGAGSSMLMTIDVAEKLTPFEESTD